MRILYPLLLSLLAIFISAHDEIDCGQDCADFVAAKIKEEKASHDSELQKCRQEQDDLKNEHEKTIASLKEELMTLESQTKKGSVLEKELRQLNKDLEAKCSKEVEEQKAMLEWTQDLAKKTQKQVFEAKMEIKELTDSLESTRINFKGIWDDLMAMWKKIVVAFKKDVDAAKEEEKAKKPEL